VVYNHTVRHAYGLTYGYRNILTPVLKFQRGRRWPVTAKQFGRTIIRNERKQRITKRREAVGCRVINSVVTDSLMLKSGKIGGCGGTGGVITTGGDSLGNSPVVRLGR
jgi:hypothetical protein